MILANGYAGEEHVHVGYNPKGHETAYGTYRVWIEGKAVSVERVDRLRDGGTTYLKLLNGRKITLPQSMRSDDRTPKLDGVDVI